MNIDNITLLVAFAATSAAIFTYFTKKYILPKGELMFRNNKLAYFVEAKAKIDYLLLLQKKT